jgi:hypothetical protein
MRVRAENAFYEEPCSFTKTGSEQAEERLRGTAFAAGGLRHGNLSMSVPRMAANCSGKQGCPGMGVGWGWCGSAFFAPFYTKH